VFVVYIIIQFKIVIHVKFGNFYHNCLKSHIYIDF